MNARRFRRPVATGVGCWLAAVAVAFVVELLLGVWSLSDLATRGVAAELPWFGVVALASFVVFGLPVALYLRYRLVAPVVVSGAYLAYFVLFGLTTGAASTPFVVLLYSWVAAPVVVLAALVEFGYRRLREKRPVAA